jgi:transposase-like protein
LYKWLKGVRPRPEQRRDEELLESKREILKLRAALRRTQEERDILKKAAVESTAQRNTLREDISGRLEAQGLSWTLIESTSDLV